MAHTKIFAWRPAPRDNMCGPDNLGLRHMEMAIMATAIALITVLWPWP